jgi:hypothetical protein
LTSEHLREEDAFANADALRSADMSLQPGRSANDKNDRITREQLPRSGLV